MYLETEILYTNGSRVAFNFTPSLAVYFCIIDLTRNYYGCDSFATYELSIQDIEFIKFESQPQDEILIRHLKKGCIIDVIVHRTILVKKELLI